MTDNIPGGVDDPEWWLDWSNQLAELVPESWDMDEDQEAIITRYFKHAAGIIEPCADDELAEAVRQARAMVDQEHPWIPGGTFRIDGRLKLRLLAFFDALLSEVDS